MDQLLVVTNKKNESTDSTTSDRLKIPTKMHMDSVKKESGSSVESEICIKKEPREDENEFPVIASTSYDMCPYYKIKNEMDEQMIKVECESLTDESREDPLDVGREIKVEEHFPINLDGKSINKIEPTEKEKDKNFLEFCKDDPYGSDRSNLVQLIVRSDSNHKDKKYICNECSKTFKRKNYLDRHLIIHTGERPFICKICKKSFNQKGALNTHLLIHSDVKPHICDTCKKGFSQKLHLKRHKCIVMGVNLFSCSQCDKTFKKKTSLVEHNRTHTGNTLFSCDLCKKAFMHISTLVKHKFVIHHLITKATE